MRKILVCAAVASFVICLFSLVAQVAVHADQNDAPPPPPERDARSDRVPPPPTQQEPQDGPYDAHEPLVPLKDDPIFRPNRFADPSAPMIEEILDMRRRIGGPMPPSNEAAFRGALKRTADGARTEFPSVARRRGECEIDYERLVEHEQHIFPVEPEALPHFGEFHDQPYHMENAPVGVPGAVSQLRSAAIALEQAAAESEKEGSYEKADKLRQKANLIWRQAREVAALGE